MLMKRSCLIVAMMSVGLCSCGKKSAAGRDENAEDSTDSSQKTVAKPQYLSKEQVVQAILAASDASHAQLGSLSSLRSEEPPALNQSTLEELTAGGSPLSYDLEDGASNFVLDDGSIAVDIDLRDLATPVRNQGQEGTCTAFATAAAMELVAKQKTGRDFDLSEQHLWESYAVGNLFSATGAAMSKKIVREDVWPYGTENPKGDLANYGLMRIAKVGGDGANASMQSMIKAIQDKKPVVWGGQSPIFDKQGIVYSHSSKYAHAVTIVGAQFDQRIGGGGYFIIKNSWGPESGDYGYIYMPFSYCSAVQCYAQPVLDVEVVESNADKLPPDPSSDSTSKNASCLGANGVTRYDHGVKTTYNGGAFTCNNGKWDKTST